MALGIGFALKVLISGVAAAITIVKSGTATGLFAPWVIQAGVAVMIATGATTSITLVVKGIENAKDKPFDWMAAILAILQPLALDFVKEFSPGEPLAKLADKAVALVLFLVGVLLWKQTSRLVAGIGVVLIFFPPAWVIARLLALNWSQGFRAAAIATPPLTWFALGLMAFGSLAVIVFKYKLDRAS